MSPNKWEGVNRQKIYDDFRINSVDVSDDYLITLFGYYDDELYTTMQEVQRLVLQNGYFIGTVGDYQSLNIIEHDGSTRRESLIEKSFRCLRVSDLVIFVLLLDKDHHRPSTGPTIEMSEVLVKGWISKCLFIIEGDIKVHFDTKLITTDPGFQRITKFDDVRPGDIEGMAEIIIGRCDQLYHKDFKI